MIKITDKISIYDTPEMLEVSGRELSASEIVPFIGGRSDVRITADVLHIDTVIPAPGGVVTVVARMVIGGDGAVIDVSGVNGRDAPKTRKPKPIDTSVPAPNGAKGVAAGGNGGRIALLAQLVEGKIRLLAAGGRGGKGQDGGDAADGKHGLPDDQVNQAGGNGSPAGPIGRAGDSRNSGNGGEVAIFVDQGSEGLEAVVTGGPEVPAAQHGKPGTPGRGGKGGKIVRFVPTDNGPTATPIDDAPKFISYRSRGWERIDTGRREADGQPGSKSPAIKGNPVSGKPGRDGMIFRGEIGAHAVPLSTRGLKLLLINAEMLHLEATTPYENGQEKALAASELAGWIFIISLAVPSIDAADLAGRASSLIHRIAVGLPPEGALGLEVPIRPIDSLLESLKTILESRWRGSGYINELKADTRTEETIRGAIAAIGAEAGTIRTEGEARFRMIDARRNEIVETIDGLSSSYQNVWLQVQKAEGRFRAAATQGNPCAAFLEIVIVVAAVAVTVMSAGSATAAAIAAGGQALAYIEKDKARKEAYDAEVKQLGGLKTELKGYAKDAQALADAAKNLKKILGGDETSPPQDHVKIGMTRKDFNDMISPYRGSAATEEFKREMDKFFSLTETRNSLLLEHDQIIVEAASIRAEIEASQRRLDNLVKKDGAALIDATIDTYEAALWLDLEVGKRVIALLQAANRAYEYLTLGPRSMDFSTTRGDHLEAEFTSLVRATALLQLPEQLNRATTCEVTIDKSSHEEVFLRLQSGEPAYVSLMAEHVAAPQRTRWDERAHSVGIKIAGLKTKRGAPLVFQAKLISCGVAWFVDQTGNQISMRVPRRGVVCDTSTALDLDNVIASRNLLDAIDAVVPTSPFGLWRLEIPGIEKHIGKVTSLTFCFAGTSRIFHNVAAEVDRGRGRQQYLARPSFDAFALASVTAVPAMGDHPAEQVHEGRVEDLREVQAGSPREEAELIRMVEDILYVPDFIRYDNNFPLFDEPLPEAPSSGA